MLSFTGRLPTAITGIIADTGAITLTASTPQAIKSTVRAVTASTLTLTGKVPVVSGPDVRKLPGTAVLTVAGQVLYKRIPIPIGSRTWALTGKTPLVGDFNPRLSATKAALTLTGYAPPETNVGNSVSTAGNALAFTSTTPTTLQSVGPQSLTLTGQAPSANKLKGELTLTGQLPTLKLTRVQYDAARTRLISLTTTYNVRMLYD